MMYTPNARPKPGEVQSMASGGFSSKSCWTIMTQIQRKVKRPAEKTKP